MATFSFELVAPERVLFSGDVDAVILPASEGDMTVMPGHEPMMTALKTGFLIITDRPGSGRRVLVRGGFADVNQRGLTVLAERALPEEEITPPRLRKTSALPLAGRVDGVSRPGGGWFRRHLGAPSWTNPHPSPSPQGGGDRG
jgi:F-type H+-transporting ATPase subunit epsilon